MKQIALILTLTAIMTRHLSAEPLDLGAEAPQVVVLDDSGATVDLGEALAEGYVLVYFYPKAHTPGCTKQACSLRDGWEELQERNVRVYGVSGDSVNSQSSFRQKHELPFPLLADPDLIVAGAFGKGRLSRQAYLFKDGRLVWRDLSAATKAQAEEVLAALDALESQN